MHIRKALRELVLFKCSTKLMVKVLSLKDSYLLLKEEESQTV